MIANQALPCVRRLGLCQRVLLVLALLLAGSGAAAAQMVSSPRLQTSEVPAASPEAYGGGEVMLELTVDAKGAVTDVNPLRATPPFTDTMAAAAESWRFQPAIELVKKVRTSVPGRVLVLGLFRAPTMYAAPAPGAMPEARGEPSPNLPRPTTLVPPAYPPNVRSDRMVLVEIELNRRGEPRGYRVLTPGTGFESAALEAVKAWRFNPPPAADAPEQIFVYAVFGFRGPVVGP